MFGNKNDKLKALIRSAGPDTPVPDFTEMVMSTIRIEVQPEESALRSLLQKTLAETPPAGFTRKVMLRVEVATPKRIEKPIIGKKAWYAIAASVVLLLSLAGFSGQASDSPPVLSPYLVTVGNILSNFFSSSRTLPSVYPLTFLSISILLVADHIIGRKRMRSDTPMGV